MFTTRFTIVAVLALVGAGPLTAVSFGQAVLAQAYLDGAAAARGAGNTAKAARLYALALTEAHGQQHALLTAKALLGAATIHIDTSEFDQAEENVRAALAICDTLSEPPAKELAEALQCMATVFFHRHEYEQAEACYAELLAGLGPDQNPAFRAVVMNDLSLVKTALEEPDAAVQLAQAAAEIMEASFGSGSAYYAQCLDTLAQALVADGRLDEAESVLQQALDVCAGHVGEDSAQYGTTLLTLSKLHHRRGDHATAIHHAERSVGLQEGARGTVHPSTRAAKSELAAMRDAHSAQAARRPSRDEWKMFDQMYGGLGLTPDELHVLREHWLVLSSPERMEHYQSFHAEVAARQAGSAPVPSADTAEGEERSRQDVADDGQAGSK